MDISTIVILLVGLVIGAVVGAVAAWQVHRARGESATADGLASEARLRAETADARADAANARAEAAQARGELARAQVGVSDARAEVADAHAMAAEVRSQLADVRSLLATAESERDHALSRAAELAADRDSMVNQFKVLSAETLEAQGRAADKVAQERLRATHEVVGPVAEALKLFHERLNDVEKERVAMATDLRNQVMAVKLTGEELRRETSGLATALRKPQVRGAWGETQLKRVVEITGMVERCDFDLQVTTRSDDKTIRPDMRVNLADGKFIFVDSKVPLSAFLDAAESADDTVRTQHLGQFARTVRTHIDQLSGKQYWRADSTTPEFVVLFLPSEAFLAGALEQMSDLHEYAAQRDVVLATPSILIAVLRAVHYGWKQAALAESAAEVFQIGRELYDRLGTMGGHFDKLGRQLNASVKAYNTAIGSLESRVMVSARRFRDLKVSDAELGQITPAEEVTRTLTTTELVEDAVQAPPMIGRGSKRRASSPLPEADELVRAEPALDDLFAAPGDGDTGSGDGRHAAG